MYDRAFAWSRLASARAEWPNGDVVVHTHQVSSTGGPTAGPLAALADAGGAISTIERTLAGIAHEHRSRGHVWPRGEPAIRETMAPGQVRAGHPRKFVEARARHVSIDPGAGGTRVLADSGT